MSEAGQPSIGNVLGFALQLREHRALLSLERRTLAPGVHLLDYEASVPGVEFPISGPLSAARFRHRRCRVHRVTLELERHALQAWLVARLRGRSLAGLRVDWIELEAAAQGTPDDAPAPWIMLSGRARSGSFGWFGCSLALHGEGRAIVVRPGRLWWIGSEPIERTALWLDLARALDPRRRSDALELRLDLAMEALRVPFVQAGWKIPALEQLELRGLAVDGQRARASWSAGSSPIEVAIGRAVEHDAVVAAAERVRAADDASSAAALDELTAAVATAPVSAQVAVLRWGIERAARHDPLRRAALARAWVRARPVEARAQRELIAALRGAGDHDELLRHVQAWSRLAVSPRRSLRSELALAHGCIDRSDFAGARARVEPLLVQLGSALGPAIARAWVLAQLDVPGDAMATLDADETLAPREKAELWAELGRVLVRQGDDAQAWIALRRAAESGDTDEAWVALAHVLLERGTPDRTALALVERIAEGTGNARMLVRLASVAERDGRHDEAARHWLAVAGAESTPASRLAALRRWLHARAIETDTYAKVVAAAARPDVVAVFERIAADAPEHVDAMLVLGEAAALAGDEARSAELDDRTVTMLRGDARSAGALVRMLERADADRDDAHAQELLVELTRIPLDDPGLVARTETVRRRLLATDPRTRARLALAQAETLERTAALLALGEAAAHEPDARAFTELTEAMLGLGGRNEVVEAWRLRASEIPDGRERADIHKHVATLLERWGDREGAIVELEHATSLAPDDAEAWLAWLDLCFASGALARAVALVRELLRRLPMGDAAYAATARRGADAALAIGDDETALELFDEILERTPDDEAVRARRDEVIATTTDPERRVGLLARIAARNTGTARVEALDERARLLAETLGRTEEAIADLVVAFEEAPERTDLAARLADQLAAAERWHELAELLRRLFPRERGGARRRTLRRLAEVLRDRLFDLPRAEQALRMALELGGNPDEDRELGEPMRLELAELLERQGRWVDLAHELQRELGPELEGATPSHPARIELMGRLARLQREVLDDDEGAARIYQRLEQLGQVPDEGLACLARAHRRAGRHAELVRVLELRATALREDPSRWATIQQHIAELLDGPLARPLEAAERYLAAFLADPSRHAASIRRARVLLSGAASLDSVRARLEEIATRVDGELRAEVDTLLADVLANHPDHADLAVERYHAALARVPKLLSALEGLGRVELRRGNLDAALPVLLAVSEHPAATLQQRADAAASAGRALVKRGRDAQALAVLGTALRHSPAHARVLLELAQIYERQGRTTEQSVVLENLRGLALPGALRAEVLHRHAALLQPAYRNDPRGREAEAAIADVLEALAADPTHPGARQLLLELARLRNEWPLTVQALSAALRPLGPGPTRARVELDIGEVLLDEGHDPEGAMQRLDAAIVEIDDDEIERRATAIALRLDRVEPLVGRVAERIRAAAERTRALEPETRARIDRLIARLHASRDAREAAPDTGPAAALLAEDPRQAIANMLHAASLGDPAQLGNVWLDAAILVWQRLRDADTAAQYALSALAAGVEHEPVAALLGDVALSCTDAMASRIHETLQSLSPEQLGPSLRLQRAQLARLLGRSADALVELTELVQRDQGEIRHRALAELDRLLAQVASPQDRLPVLRMRVAELSPDDEAELADGAAELAAVELATGDATRALATCRLGLAALPEHRTLLRMQVELLEQHDLPEELAVALERYGSVCASPRERARQLVRAARIVLDRGAQAQQPTARDAAVARASTLLAQAIAADDGDASARALALPLAFAAGHWTEVDQLGRWLWRHGHHREPSLVFAALDEAFLRGQCEIAEAIGSRHANDLGRHVLPGLRQLLSEIAMLGPLEHIDAVLDAAARLAGGSLRLFDALRRWAMGRPLQSGLALALARMHERHGQSGLARRLLQLAAFLADRGPLAELLTARPPPATLVLDAGRSLDGHAAIRALMRALALAAARGQPPAARDGLPRPLAHELDAWSEWLAPLPLVVDEHHPGVLALVPERGRMVLVAGRGLVHATPDELRFHVAHAAVGVACGLAELLAGDDAELADRLDALAVLANPAHVPTGARARAYADLWSDRGALEIGAELRVAVLDELGHWLSRPALLGQLRSELAHHWWLVATESSDELRGSLRALAHETGTMRGERVDPLATLRTEAAQRLLGALGLYAASSAGSGADRGPERSPDRSPDRPSDRAGTPTGG